MKLFAAATALLALSMPLSTLAQTLPGKHKRPKPPEMTEGDMPMKHAHAPAPPSTSLTVTGLDGATKTYSPADLKTMPRVALKVHNSHTNADEIYEGVPVAEFLKATTPGSSLTPKVSRNITVLVFGATDNFHVVLTACDVDPTCHNGNVIIADTLNNQPLTTDGAFKLIISEDKKPARWARNLNSLTVKALQ